MSMVQLPWLDDIRTPETEPNWVGEGHPTPDVVIAYCTVKLSGKLSNCSCNLFFQTHVSDVHMHIFAYITNNFTETLPFKM